MWFSNLLDALKQFFNKILKNFHLGPKKIGDTARILFMIQCQNTQTFGKILHFLLKVAIEGKCPEVFASEPTNH